jgi:hypothetical protein
MAGERRGENLVGYEPTRCPQALENAAICDSVKNFAGNLMKKHFVAIIDMSGLAM